MSDSARWLPVAEAARVSRLSESTARRHIRSGRLPTRTGTGGVALVDVEAARALARLPRSASTSKPASTSAASGGDGGGGGGAGNGTAPRDGALAARVFQALEQGSRPVDLVSQLQAAPADVAALVRAWQDLRATEGNTLADRVAGLEAQVAALQATLAAVARVLPPAGVRCFKCGQPHTSGLAVICMTCGAQGVSPPVPAPAAAS